MYVFKKCKCLLVLLIDLVAVWTFSDNCLATQFTSYLGIFVFCNPVHRSQNLCLTIPTCIFSALHMGQSVLCDPVLLFWVMIMWQLPAMGHMRSNLFLGHCYKPCRFFDWPWEKSVRETTLPCLGLVLPGWVFLEPKSVEKAQFLLVDINGYLGTQFKIKIVRFR